MNKLRKFRCNLLDIRDNNEVYCKSSKSICMFMWDNNPAYTLQYIIKPDNPSAVYLSSVNKLKNDNAKIYAYDSSNLSITLEMDEKRKKQLQVLFHKFSIQFHRRKNKNEFIFNHVLFMHNISVQIMNPSPFDYEIQHVQESFRDILMENTPLMKIFDSIQTWLCIPFIKLSYHNCYYLKQFEFLESYLATNKEWDGLTVLKEIEEMKKPIKTNKNLFNSNVGIQLEIYQLTVEKSRKGLDLLRKDKYKIILQKIIDLKEDENSLVKGTLKINQKSFFTKSFDSILQFLEINHDDILYQKETFFSGNVIIPIHSLDIKYRKYSRKISTYENVCEKCQVQLNGQDQTFYFNDLSDRSLKIFCQKCHHKHVLFENIKKFFHMTHFDAIVQFFFYFPNLGHIENENSFSLCFRYNSWYRNTINVTRMRITITNDIKIQVKKSSGIENVMEALQMFIDFVCKLQNRHHYFFLNYEERPVSFYIADENRNAIANTPDLNTIQNIFAYPMIEFDMDIFSNIHKINTIRIESFIPEIKNNDIQEENMQVSCKDILKNFSYTRYCDRRRMPSFSFEEPDQATNLISIWPPIEKFNHNNDYTIHVKSPKFKIPIKIIWNRMTDSYARFIMFIKKKKKTKYDEVLDERIVEFSKIYFFIEKSTGHYLSVTKLSPAFLPSITMKEKIGDNISTYMSKHKKLQGELNLFMNSIYIENNVEFFLEQKYTLPNLLHEFRVAENFELDVTAQLSLREQIQNKEKGRELFSDIENVYHYCCHVLQCNLLILTQTQKHELAVWKEISKHSSYFYFFDRYMILVETLDDKSSNGIISNQYQPIVMKKNNHPNIDSFYSLQNCNTSFYEDLKTIYEVVILKHDILFPFLEMSTLTKNISHQVVDNNGKTKFIIVQNHLLYVSENIPILTKPIENKIDLSIITTINKETKEELQSHLQEYLCNLLKLDTILKLELYIIDSTSNLMIASFKIPLYNEVHLQFGLLFYQNSIILSEYHSSSSEILFYLKSQDLLDKKYQLHLYKCSFIENDEMKYKLLSMFHKYYSKRKFSIHPNKITETFIKKYIIFKENYQLGDFKIPKKIIVPSNYGVNLANYLQWFASIENKKLFLRGLKLRISFSFDFKKRKHTLIK